MSGGIADGLFHHCKQSSWIFYGCSLSTRGESIPFCAPVEYGIDNKSKNRPGARNRIDPPLYLGSSHKKSNWIVCNGGKGRRRCLHSLQASPWIIRCSFGAIPNSRTTPHQGKTSQVRTPQQDHQQVRNSKISPSQHKTSQDKTSSKHLVRRFLLWQL